MFPPDAKDAYGQFFWSGPKRCPTPIIFNPEEPLHKLFISAAANLIAFNLGIQQNRDAEFIATEAAKIVFPPYVPQTQK